MNAFVGYLIIVIIAIVFMVTIGFQWNKRKTPLNKNFESFITAGIDPETLGQVPIQAYDPTDGQEKMAHTWHLKTPGGMGAGPSNYSWQQPIGYNWSQSWRPYFWRLYPNIPQWIPAGRDPQANQTPMPHDKELLRLMESPCQPGVSPEGYLINHYASIIVTKCAENNPIHISAFVGQ
jgi:hypothetical protein